MLGLSRKAGKMILGSDAVLDAINDYKVFLVLLTKDISRRSGEKISAAANNRLIQVTDLPLSMNEIEMLTGKRSGIIGISDKGFAEAIRKLIE